ncbi:MAG: DUF933 domain-containing protein [bacterium]
MRIGIVGFPFSGKTTIFNSLTGIAETSSHAKGKEVKLGLIKVPDTRIDELTTIFQPRKTVYGEITFADIPGHPQEKKIFDEWTLTQLNNIDAMVIVIKTFTDLGDTIDPCQDLSTIQSELILADLVRSENILNRLKKQGSTDLQAQLLEKIYTHLLEEKALRLYPLSPQELKLISGFSFLSLLPVMVVVNCSEEGVDNDLFNELSKISAAQEWPIMKISGKIEEEIAQLAPEDQADFLTQMNLESSARDRFIRESYKMLDLISFFTVGKDEVRSWPIKNGTVAQKAAGKVHSDIERGFIRAELIAYEDFMRYKDMNTAKKHGAVRLEGKTYIVQDGDIINFRFNV